MIIDFNWMVQAEDALVDVLGAVLQSNKSLKGKFVDALIAKGVGGAGAAGVTGLVAILGTASTGTAIGTLTGAAAQSATYFWIGSIVGGGAIVGGGVLIAIAVAVGLGASRYWRGNTRSHEALSEHELEILGAIETVIPALRHDIDNQKIPDRQTQDSLLALWADLCASIDIYQKQDADALSLKHRIALKRALGKMQKLLKKLR